MSFTTRRVRQEKKPSTLHRVMMAALPLVRSVMALQDHFTHVQEAEHATVKREKVLKKTTTILVAALVVVLMLIGTLKVLLRLKEMAFGMVSMAGAELAHDEHGLTNVLLLGEGDSDHDGVDLTDTIMIASLDPTQTRSAVLISIPRDTYVLNAGKMGKGRINSLYRDYKIALKRKGMSEQEASDASLKELNTEIGTLIGMDIHGSIKVNFSGFIQGIDAIGGIDVEVPEDLTDPEYPGPNYTYETFSIGKGPQHLDGATALKYARSRHSTSDFSRSGRQQQIIAAAIEKVKSDGIIKNAGRMTDLLSIVAKNVESTFSTRELIGLASMGKSLDRTRMLSIQLNDQNGLYGSIIEQGGFLYSPPREEFDGAAVLLPVSVPEFPVTWKQIQVFAELVMIRRDLFLNPPRIVVLNAGAKEGSARKLGGELYRYMFNVKNTHNYARKNPEFPQSFIAINPALLQDETHRANQEIAKNVATFLGTTIGVSGTTDPDGGAFAQDDADIAIVLGKDFQYTSLQDRLHP